jgi:hypothetical protein
MEAFLRFLWVLVDFNEVVVIGTIKMQHATPNIIANCQVLLKYSKITEKMSLIGCKWVYKGIKGYKNV